MFPSGSFDIALSSSMFKYMGTDLQALEEMARVVRVGGVLAVFDVSDLGCKAEAFELRKTHFQGQAKKHASVTPDHLYLSKEFWVRAARLLRLKLLSNTLDIKGPDWVFVGCTVPFATMVRNTHNFVNPLPFIPAQVSE